MPTDNPSEHALRVAREWLRHRRLDEQAQIACCFDDERDVAPAIARLIDRERAEAATHALKATEQVAEKAAREAAAQERERIITYLVTEGYGGEPCVAAIRARGEGEQDEN